MLRSGAIGIGALALLAGCGEPDVRLPGERLDLRAGLAGAAVPVANRAVPISLPAPTANAAWTQRGGESDHDIAHLALDGALSPLFVSPIGRGDSRSARITADPVVANGRVFTLDSRAQVTALSTGGETLWTRDLTPPTDNRTDASGGGLATDGATVYAATGFGRVSAIDAQTGGVRWTQDLDAPGSSAPTVRNGIVYAVSRDGRGWALDANTGRVEWTLSGIDAVASFDGGAGAAVDDNIAVFPFPSGELIAAFPDGGLRRWNSYVAGSRTGEAASVAAGGISGDPVLEDGRVYVGNATGRLAALDAFTGDTIWTATDGAVSPVVPAGGSLFLVNDLGQLVRLDAASGAPIWRVPLPNQEERGFLRRNRLYAHYGPILAGGRLIVASSDGVLRQFDPVSGASLGDVALPGGAASNPVVVNGVLYVVTRDGTLAAFR